MPECTRCDRHYSLDDGHEATKYCHACAHERVEELEALISSPQTEDFLQAVRVEAAHQVERWGVEHDESKADQDWFWLLGYLAGKAVHEGKSIAMTVAVGNNPTQHEQKRLHHVITTAAACLNWHRHLTGENTSMRPGIEPPKEVSGV